MGLSDYRKYKKEQELKGSETISSLRNEIEQLKKEIAELKSIYVAPKVFTKEEEDKIKKIQENVAKPREIIEMFATDLEEFNPNA